MSTTVWKGNEDNREERNKREQKENCEIGSG